MMLLAATLMTVISAVVAWVSLQEQMKLPSTPLVPIQSLTVIRTAGRICATTNGCSYVDEKFVEDDPSRPNCLLYSENQQLRNPSIQAEANVSAAKLFAVSVDSSYGDCPCYPIVLVHYGNGTTVTTEPIPGGGPPFTTVIHGEPQSTSPPELAMSTEYTDTRITTVVTSRNVTATARNKVMPNTTAMETASDETQKAEPTADSETTTTSLVSTSSGNDGPPSSTEKVQMATEPKTTTTAAPLGFSLWSQWTPCGRLAGTCDFTTRVRSCLSQPLDCVGNTTDTMVCGNSASSYPFPCAPCLTGCKPLLRKMPNGTQYYYCSPKGWDNRTQRVFYDTPVLFQDSCL